LNIKEKQLDITIFKSYHSKILQKYKEIIMKNRFYSNALKAAKISPDAFALEFKNPEAYANIQSYYNRSLGYYGGPLIHTIIEELPDNKLPAILTILIENNVDIEIQDPLGKGPLATAANYHKLKAVNLLIANKAEINTHTCPPLCSIIQSKLNEITFKIIDTLIAHKANIDIQDKFSRTPLMIAASEKSLALIKYLLSHQPNLFLKYGYAGETQHQTAIGIAYDEYISAKKCFVESHDFTKNAKACLDTLIDAAKEYLFKAALKESDEIFLMTNVIKNLSGKFQNIYPESNNNAVTKLLEKEMQPVVSKIRNEKIQAFCLGSYLRKPIDRKIPPVYFFFCQDGRKDLTKHIFSFVHAKKK